MDLAQIELQVQQMVTFDTNMPVDELVAEHERAEREAKKKRQIEYCGSWAARLDPANGRLINYQWHCGYWRECPVCFERRVNQVRGRIERIVDCVTEVGIVEMSEEEGRKFVRYLRTIDQDYRRYPISLTSSIIFFDHQATLLDGGWIPESELTLEDIDPAMLANTPRKKRWSGSLGEKIKEETDDGGETIVVSVKEFIAVDISWEDKRIAWEEAVERTSHLSPAFDAEELSFAGWVRMKEWKKCIEKKGGRVPVERSVRVTLSSNLYMNWSTLEVIRQENSPGNQSSMEIASGDVEMTDKMRKTLEELGVSAEQLELIAG